MRQSRQRQWRRWLPALALAAAAALPAAAAIRVTTPGAWRFMRNGNAGGPAGQLPVTGSDGHGNSWMAYQPGYLQSQSNFPVYNQTATIQVNGQQPSSTNNAARLDEKTGELVMDNLQLGGTLTLTRRVLIDAEAGGVRVVDVIRNGGAAEQAASVTISSTINFGVQQSQIVNDPRRPGKPMAWVGQVPAGPGRACVDVYAGPGAKVSPAIDSQPGNNVATATINATVPANGQVAIVHYHLVVPTVEQGTAWVANLKPAKLLADLPKDVRRSVVNFRTDAGLLGDQEVLRGDLLDAVELRNGDRLNGTLTDAAYKLDTFYGTVELNVDRVVGLINAGTYRPRQLLVTTDGQIFGGYLQRPTIGLELTTGQKVAIPLAQVARVGYRHRPAAPTTAPAAAADDAAADEADVATLRPPYVLLTTGDRVGVKLPDRPVTVVTRYGTLSLPPAVLASIAFAGDDAAVHTITLTDGSHFSGLVTAADIEATLTAGGSPTTVKFPVGSINRLILAGDADEDAAPDPAKPAAEEAPALRLRRDDVLVGTLAGPLAIDTAFDTVTIDAAEIKALARPTAAAATAADLSVTTWDGTVFNGQVRNPTVDCHLASGVDVKVPVGLIDGYTNPTPVVPALLRDKIKALVAALDADDWQARDAAEKQLVKLGPTVAGALRQARDKQSPEAQARINAVLRDLAAAKK